MYNSKINIFDPLYVEEFKISKGTLSDGRVVSLIGSDNNNLYYEVDFNVPENKIIIGIDVNVSWKWGENDDATDDLITIKYNGASIFNHAEPGVTGSVGNTSHFEDTYLEAGTLVITGNIDNGSGAYLYLTKLILYCMDSNYSVVTQRGAPNHAGEADCPICYASDDAIASRKPISLRYGEKREKVTDLRLNSPGESLIFTRSYRQSQQNVLDFMGLGWTHNHAISLDNNTPGILIARMPSGGEARFVGNTSDGFVGDPGSNSTIEYSADHYTLTAADKSIYVFNDQGNLINRSWPNNESWTYAYHTTGQLKSVVDAYGNQLRFAYINNPGGFDHSQLWRVGDQTVPEFDDPDDLNSSTPVGRFVVFGYVENKQEDSGNPGTIIDGGKALLATVKTVRKDPISGNPYEWQYTYHDDDLDILNYLKTCVSPAVDTTGDGVADGSITLKELDYSYVRDLAINGDMEDAEGWNAITSAMHSQSNVQVDGGSYAWHVNANQNDGIQGNFWNLIAGRDYTVSARVYVVNGSARMKVDTGTDFDMATIGTGSWETLSATHTPLTTQNNIRLQFVANGGAAEFYVDNVRIEERSSQISTITERLGKQGTSEFLQQVDYVFQPGGENITMETISGRTTTYYFADGIYAGTANGLGDSTFQGLNAQYRMETQSDANGNITALGWSADGKQLEGVTDALGNPTSFTYDTEGRLISTMDVQGHQTVYEYTGNLRQPSVIQVSGEAYISRQEFDYDAKGKVIAKRRLSSEVTANPPVYELISETVYDYNDLSEDGNEWLGELRENAHSPLEQRTTFFTYDDLGRVVKTQKTGLFGTCEFSYTVYDPADNVLVSACGLTNVTPPTTVQEAIALYDANDSQRQHTRVTVHEYDSLGRRVKTISNAGTAWERTSLTVYDALDRVIRTIQNYVADAGIPNPYVADRSLFSHGIMGDENRISETVYNECGQVRKQVDALDNATLYGYDDAGRLVKTVVGASLPAYDNTYSAGDPDLSDYGPVSPADDEDLITEQAYDPAGNLVMSVDPVGRTTYTVYDALNRAVKVVANAKSEATLNPVDEADAAINDPRRDTYVPSEDPDQDHISETTYDALGRVVRTRRLVDVRGATDQWETTLLGYNTLGQQIRTIRFAATPDYDVASDPKLAGYPTSTNADVDLATETVFDPAGRVMYTQDIAGQRNWTGYDGLGRTVKQIRNAVGEKTDDGVNDPRSSSYTPSLNPDEDMITLTTYNGDGQVIDTYDVLGRVTTHVYDLAGRQIRMVRNYMLQSEDPMNWVWSETNHRWELSETDSTPVERSSDPINQPDNHDINLVSETVYDEQGRSIEQWDHLRRCQRTVFDISDRVVMTIRNYVPNSQPPENWVWSTANARWEDGNGTAINHGLDKDRNQISTTSFDADGRVSAVRDAAGRETQYAYDKLGRRVTIIANYVDGVFDPASPDEDQITQTVYDKSGQVVATIDSRGTKTAFEYDDAGRRVLVIRDAEGSLESQTYTCYDKAGKVLRTIANYQPIPAGEGVSADVFGNILPDAWDENGEWHWQPNETLTDAQIVTQYIYDSAGRRIGVIDPLGNTSQTVYGKDGQVRQMIDAENVTTAYRYDLARRRTMVVQNYTGGQPTDIDTWSWNDQTETWESNQS